MMLKIAICEDEQREIETAKKNLQLYLASRPELNAEVYEYTSALELLSQIDNQFSFDILLMDIFLPGILGIEAAQQLREDRNKCQIIFLTTSRDYAVDAFAVNAIQQDDSGDGLRMLQEHLGHSNFNTTARYRKVSGEEQREWYQKLWNEGQ